MDVAGIQVSDLPDGWTVLEAVCCFRCLSEEGEVAYVVRTSEALQGMEAIGMLRTAALQQEQSIARGWEDD